MAEMKSIGDLHIQKIDNPGPIEDAIEVGNKKKKVPKGKVDWTRDLKDRHEYLGWQEKAALAMWQLFWFEESRKQRTDLSPEIIESAFEQIKTDVCTWVRLATQKNGGYPPHARSWDFHPDNLTRIGMNIIIQTCFLAMHNVFGKLPEFVDGDIRD